VQTIEVEVTRVVYRETLVTPTPAPLVPCSPERLTDSAEVVIGALLPLSTPGAWMRSANMQSGLNLALERLNMGGVAGVPARLVLYDTGDDPARSAQMAEQLIARDCAVGLIVGLGDAAARPWSRLPSAFASQLCSSTPPILHLLQTNQRQLSGWRRRCP